MILFRFISINIGDNINSLIIFVDIYFYMSLRDKIKNILREDTFDDFDFIKGKPNPFMSNDPLVVVWLDNTVTEEEVGELWNMIYESGANFNTYKEKFVKSILSYLRSGSAYVKSFINTVDVKKVSYGNNQFLFDEYKYSTVREDLIGDPYVEWDLKDLFEDNLNESRLK